MLTIASNGYDNDFDDHDEDFVMISSSTVMTMNLNYERCSLKCCDSASCPSCHSSALLGGLGGQARRQASIQICPRPISTQNPATGLAEPDHGGKCWPLIGRGRLSWDEASVGYRKWKHPAADSNSGRAAEFGKCFRCIDEKHSKTFEQWELCYSE